MTRTYTDTRTQISSIKVNLKTEITCNCVFSSLFIRSHLTSIFQTNLSITPILSDLRQSHLTLAFQNSENPTLPSPFRPQTLLPLRRITQLCLLHLPNLRTHSPLRLQTSSNSTLSLPLRYIIPTSLIRCNTSPICLLLPNTNKILSSSVTGKIIHYGVSKYETSYAPSDVKKLSKTTSRCHYVRLQ